MDTQPQKQSFSNKISILIVGGTGKLGSLIAKHCLSKSNLCVHILSKNPEENKDLCQLVTQNGGKCLRVDITDIDKIRGCTKGIHTVIYAIPIEDKAMVDGQLAILNDAIENGVKRFIPSDFSFDYSKIQEDEHPVIGNNIRFRRELEKSSVKGLFIHNGYFTEKFFLHHQNGVTYWESMDQKVAFIAYEDVARYVAAALAKPDKIGDLRIAADQITIREACGIYDVIRGTNIQLQTLGNLADLYKAIGKANAKGETKKALILNYQIFVSDGRGALDSLDNDEFPEIKPLIHFDKFVLEHPERKLGE